MRDGEPVGWGCAAVDDGATALDVAAVEDDEAGMLDAVAVDEGEADVALAEGARR